MGDFYGTGIEIWTGFGPVGITERKKILADYEQLLRLFFLCFHGQKKMKIKNIVASKLKSYIK